VIVFCGAEVVFRMPPIFIDEEYFNIFCAVSTVKNFRPQQQSVKDNENVAIHIEYWFKQLI